MEKVVKLRSLVLMGAVALSTVNVACAQKKLGSENIRLNQVGYYPNEKKIAVGVNTSETKFSIISAKNKKDTLFTANLKKAGVWKYSKEDVSQADFSSFTTPGTYMLCVKGLDNSYPFEIANHVYEKIAKASIKGYYFQRASMELTEEFAGRYARAAGHPDNEVLIHNSAASAKRPTGTKISSPGGWYDAGDYNKYIVNSGISISTLLSSYEDFPAYYKTLNINIPESGNALPDILDEVTYNLRWMLTMQDSEDGGVYHKLTNSHFDGVVLPQDAKTERYVIIKTTSATLDFAASMAHANRIYKGFEKQLPGLADSCLKASLKAYDWAKANPAVLYTNKTQDELHDPEIKTGAYEDDNVSDEFFWAASELFVTTLNPAYLQDMNITVNGKKYISIPNWQSVGMLGVYSLVKNADKFTFSKDLSVDIDTLKAQYLRVAKSYQLKSATSAYGTVMGLDGEDFVWGSNAIAGNQCVFMMKAYLMSNDPSLYEAAITNFDYLLGRNATGFCYVTGFGSKPTMHPHHRPSQSDDNVKPVPGLLSGGPNYAQQDAKNCGTAVYTSKLPAMSYMDEECSYASNEIAINWNAPLVYIANAAEALEKK